MPLKAKRPIARTVLDSRLVRVTVPITWSDYQGNLTAPKVNDIMDKCIRSELEPRLKAIHKALRLEVI